MEIPRELRWIGPLFAILYIILWLTRGFAPFSALAVYSIGITLIVPHVLIQAILVLVFLGISKRYRIAAMVFFLSYFCSGVLSEPLPVSFPPGSTPPPMPVRIPILLLTPSLTILNLLFYSQFLTLSAIIGLSLLSAMSFLTTIVTGLATEGKIDAVLAMLFFVVIIICWTFLYLPLIPNFGIYTIMTPMPLGPLVALNILPWVPVRKIEQQENQTQ